MRVAGSSRLVVRTDADGGLVISQRGALDEDACRRLNEAIIGALRSGSTRVVIDLRDAATDGAEAAAGVRRVLRAGQALARHLEVTYEVRGGR
jgi:hypothetical protein